MQGITLSPGLIALILYVVSAMYVHYRGRVRHPFSRQMLEHSTLLAPVNCVMYLFSAVPNRPFIDPRTIPNLSVLRDNWEMIRDEGLQLYDAGHVKRSDKLDDIGFNSFFKTGWKRFYLRWYQGDVPSAEKLCPRTLALLDRCPNIKAAMFVMLPKGSKLGSHRDPYAGSLRYHLGLRTPNSDSCFIDVDGERYAWRDGQDVVFDETFIHTAHNQSDVDRLILFCDVERPMNNPLARWFNRAFGRVAVAAAAARNMEGDQVGALNKAFHGLYQFRLLGKKLKAYNRTLYYVAKYALFAGLIYLLFF